MFGRAYILVPDMHLRVGLYPEPHPSGAIGQVTDSTWQGTHDHDIAAVRCLYFEEDRALAVWEVDAWSRLDEFAHGRLRRLFEAWLRQRFPGAIRMFSDNVEPFEDTSRNQDFLRSLGYQPSPGTHRIVGKDLDVMGRRASGRVRRPLLISKRLRAQPGVSVG